MGLNGWNLARWGREDWESSITWKSDSLGWYKHLLRTEALHSLEQASTQLWSESQALPALLHDWRAEWCCRDSGPLSPPTPWIPEQSWLRPQALHRTPFLAPEPEMTPVDDFSLTGFLGCSSSPPSPLSVLWTWPAIGILSRILKQPHEIDNTPIFPMRKLIYRDLRTCQRHTHMAKPSVPIPNSFLLTSVLSCVPCFCCDESPPHCLLPSPAGSVRPVSSSGDTSCGAELRPGQGRSHWEIVPFWERNTFTPFSPKQIQLHYQRTVLAISPSLQAMGCPGVSDFNIWPRRQPVSFKLVVLALEDGALTSEESCSRI